MVHDSPLRTSSSCIFGEMNLGRMGRPLFVSLLCIVVLHAAVGQDDPTSSIAPPVPETTSEVDPSVNPSSSETPSVSEGPSVRMIGRNVVVLPSPTTAVENSSQPSPTSGTTDEVPTSPSSAPETLPTPEDSTPTLSTLPNTTSLTETTSTTLLTSTDAGVLTSLPPEQNETTPQVTPEVDSQQPTSSTTVSTPSEQPSQVPDLSTSTSNTPPEEIQTTEGATLTELTDDEVPTTTSEPDSTVNRGATVTPETLATNTSGSDALENEEQCLLIDNTFQCKEPIICYGSGTIDCEQTNGTTNETSASSRQDSTLVTSNLAGGRTFNNTCEMAGSIRCEPSPLLDNCSGKTKCESRDMLYYNQIGGLKDWVIVVIAVCATIAVFILAVLIYVLFVSWKKLKVQPQQQQGISTVHYINHNNP